MREPLRDSERLKHMLEAIGNIEACTIGVSFDILTENLVLRHALTWNVMVIGEAANKLTKEFCAAHPETNWRAIAGMRHVLVHDYYQIDVDELWQVVKEDIQPLRLQLEKYLSDMES